MALDTTLKLLVGATQTKVADLATASFPLAKTYALALASGTGANQADLLFSDTRTLSASSSEDLDLAASLADVFGATLTFVKVKAIIIRADPGNTNNVIVGGAASNQFVGPFGSATHTIAIAPGGFFAICRGDVTGWGVTAGTGDLLKIANSGSGSSVSYDIIIIGTSA